MIFNKNISLLLIIKIEKMLFRLKAVEIGPVLRELFI